VIIFAFFAIFMSPVSLFSDGETIGFPSFNSECCSCPLPLLPNPYLYLLSVPMTRPWSPTLPGLLFLCLTSYHSPFRLPDSPV
jgi:hypothetical protein